MISAEITFFLWVLLVVFLLYCRLERNNEIEAPTDTL